MIKNRNFFAFVWHASWLALTTTFTEINTVLPGMILHVGGTQFHIGLLTSIMIGLPMLSQLIFASYLTPKVYKKPFLLGGIYMRVIALAGVAWTLNHFTGLDPTLVIVLVFSWILVFTFSGAFAGVSYTDILGKSIEGQERRKFFVVKQILASIGVLASALVARQILARLDYPNNYIWLFALASGMLFIASLGFLVLKEKPTQSVLIQGSLFDILKYIPKALREDIQLRRYIIISNLAGVAITMVPFYIALVKDQFGLEMRDIGNFLLVQMVGMIVSNFIWSRLLSRGDYTGVLKYWSLLGATIPLLMIAISWQDNPSFFFIIFFLSGALMSGRKIGMDGLLLEISNEENRVLYSGIQGAFNLTIALVPLLSGILIISVGFSPIFFVASMSMLTAYFVIRNFTRHEKAS